VVLFGRSNVGKSSLINTILQRRGTARISKTPGKTRTANFFLINRRFYLVDMPGYGYAKVSKAEIARWRKIFEQYTSDGDRNNAVVQLIDLRHPPTDDDRRIAGELSAMGRPYCLVFNKSDKVKREQVDRQISDALAHLGVTGNVAVVPFSSVSGEGKRELWRWIEDVLDL